MPNFKVTIKTYRSCIVEAPDKETAEQWVAQRTGNELFADEGRWEPHSVEESASTRTPGATVHADGKHTWNWGFD